MRCVIGLVVLLATAGVCSAQDGGDDPLPTLDALLGTEGEGSAGSEAVELPAGDASDSTELDRLLSGQEIVDEFRLAADLMNRSARRLGDAGDTGLATQRMQTDVLAALDKLIADAQQRGQQSSSSSSSESQQQQQQRQQQQAKQQSSPQASTGDNRGEADAPGGRDAALGPERAADLAAWGNLPARLRDALLQGASDSFSATYRRLTEDYYRRLAEDPEE